MQLGFLFTVLMIRFETLVSVGFLLAWIERLVRLGFGKCDFSLRLVWVCFSWLFYYHPCTDIVGLWVTRMLVLASEESISACCFIVAVLSFQCDGDQEL